MIKHNLSSIHLKHLLPDIVIIVASIYSSLFLRVGLEDAPAFISNLHSYVPLIVGARLIVFTLTGCYSIMWRYVSTADVIKLGKASAISTMLIIALSFFIVDFLGNVPRSLFLIEGVLTLSAILGVRILRRVKFESRHYDQIRHGKRTLIYGAGYNGKTLADRFAYDVHEATLLIGFVDDDVTKVGTTISGTKVLGTSKNIPDLIQANSITQLIIASTQLHGEKIREVIEMVRPFNIKPRIISRRLADEESAKGSVIDRDIQLSDLLNRPPKNVDLKSVHNMIQGKRVLVTGAGGSIGSEISKQILEQGPGRLLLLDHSEFNLYEIDRELRTSTTCTNQVVPLLMDAKDRSALFNRLKEYQPDIIFHAAAYKHVHLVEANPFFSILNNVLSTKNLLEYASEHGVENFVLVSTDKAVNPAGVMGATKRVCEMLLSSMARENNSNFCSVRFGNVLGSSGSLIPLLKKQIRNGGPVTVTHKDMTRYFMLIPEAVSLVLKAATIARPADICVLKMGAPVKILDVAKNLIALMGKGEIEIMFTGLRPGEKMYEELYLRGDELKTEHPDILTLPKGDMDDQNMAQEFVFSRVSELLEHAQKADKQALFILNELVKSTYVPPDHIKNESSKVSYLVGPNHKVH